MNSRKKGSCLLLSFMSTNIREMCDFLFPDTMVFVERSVIVNVHVPDLAFEHRLHLGHDVLPSLLAIDRAVYLGQTFSQSEVCRMKYQWWGLYEKKEENMSMFACLHSLLSEITTMYTTRETFLLFSSTSCKSLPILLPTL